MSIFLVADWIQSHTGDRTHPQEAAAGLIRSQWHRAIQGRSPGVCASDMRRQGDTKRVIPELDRAGLREVLPPLVVVLASRERGGVLRGLCRPPRELVGT